VEQSYVSSAFKSVKSGTGHLYRGTRTLVPDLYELLASVEIPPNFLVAAFFSMVRRGLSLDVPANFSSSELSIL